MSKTSSWDEQTGIPSVDGGLPNVRSITGGDGGAASADEVAKIVMALLMDPSVQQMLAQSLSGGQSGAPGAGGNQRIPGYVDNPTPRSMWGDVPQGGGPVQWLGGMPPGYDDEVAKRLSKQAIMGNMWGMGGVGQALGGGLSKALGGGALGSLLGGAVQALPLLSSFFKMPK